MKTLLLIVSHILMNDWKPVWQKHAAGVNHKWTVEIDYSPGREVYKVKKKCVIKGYVNEIQRQEYFDAVKEAESTVQTLKLT